MRQITLVLLLFAAVAAKPAGAYWSAGGSGAGQAPTADMPAGNETAVELSGSTATVTWNQSAFLGAALGSYSGGGYTVRRLAAGGGEAVTASGGCSTTIGGSGATLSCAESAVPYGEWQYAVTPVLGSFTGASGPWSAVVTVRPPPPTLGSVTAQNPAPEEPTGDIALDWSPVADATGYNVYRRSGGGTYDHGSPLNGATPVTATAFTDPGANLTGGTTYQYVVRAVGGSPSLESVDSAEGGATAIARPAAPATVTATAEAGSVTVGWTGIAEADGYNVYRRASAGSYDFSSPLNGATPVTGTTYSDTSGVDGTAYSYGVRSVITGAADAQVESLVTGESGSVTYDALPGAPTSVTIESGGNLLTDATCGYSAGTRFVNRAGRGSVSVAATVPADSGDTVVFSATTPGSTAVGATAAVSGSSATASLDMSPLADGPVTLTARSKDSSGRLSEETTATVPIVKDVVGGALGSLAYTDALLTFADSIGGASECGATIAAVETAGPNVGTTFPLSGTFRVTSAGGAFSGFAVEAIAGTLLVPSPYGYEVTATDLAGNAGTKVSITGDDTA